MNHILYRDPRISVTALNRFLAHFEAEKEELHTFAVYKDDTCLVRLAPAPYRPDDKREIYSLSKSFCSTAIGLLCDDGRLSVEDRIVDLFPEKCPEVITENLSKMRVRHVLSMNTGHDACVMPNISHEEDAVRAFLAQPVPHEPGTFFAYNTGATCLLSCIVEKISGLPLVDFLTERLFVPLGIENVRWNTVISGQNEGGCGAHVSCDDIVKLGLLYLHKGVWRGKRLLSEKWVNEATHTVSENGDNGTSDWCCGYGYQFWMNVRDGFRGDGAFGQYCYVLPKEHTVVAIQSEIYDMQTVIFKLNDFLDHMFDADDADEVRFPAYLPLQSRQHTVGFENIVWHMDPNPMGWRTVTLAYHSDENALHAVLSDGCDQYVIVAGNGEWRESEITAKMFKPKIIGLMQADKPERCRFMASYEATADGLHIHLRYRNAPHNMHMCFTRRGNTLQIETTPGDRLYPEARVITGRTE